MAQGGDGTFKRITEKKRDSEKVSLARVNATYKRNQDQKWGRAVDRERIAEKRRASAESKQVTNQLNMDTNGNCGLRGVEKSVID